MSSQDDFFTHQFALALLRQTGLLGAEEGFGLEPAVPASVGDVLKSKKYWDKTIKRWRKYGKEKGVST